MASNLRVDSIVPATGANVSIGTATGGVNIPGVLTYEDVTNVDSVGVITARSGINVSGGRVLIGTTTEGSVGADELTIATSGSTGLTIRSGTSNDGNIFFSDTTSGAGEYAGYVQYEHANNALRFGTASAERLRITSDGKLGVNTTAPVETVGIAGSMRFVTANGTKRMITALPSGTYSTSVSGGSAIGFERIADGGGGSDEIYFETHWQGNRHGESMRINKKGHVTKPHQPVFDVCGASGNPSGAGYITFTTVKVNIGSHYSTGTGKFTAPVAGTYFFSFGCIKSGNSSLARLHLYKNGSSANDRQLRMPTGGDGYGENGAKTNIVTLAANDEIQVYMSEGTIHGGTAYLYFNGYLIG